MAATRPPLPLVAPGDIPEDLLGYVSTFDLPGGERIRRARYETHEGWSIEMHQRQWMYADGVVGASPRARACEAHGLVDEDELQGRPDEDWDIVARLEDEFAARLVMPLARVWEVALAHGLGNRYARVDDRVRLRADGRPGVVVNPGTDHDLGRYVRVRLDDGDVGTYRLAALVFDDE